MNYVFFDIECANCIHGEGKICSFGYVKTDEDFHILEEKDILINPDAPFLLGNAKKGKGITLAYPLFRFRESPLFPRFYPQIKKLLSDKDTLVFGFAVGQDASYVSYSCARYHLPYIEYEFFDIQKFEKIRNHRKNCSSLQSLIEEYKENVFTYHRSQDDAKRTREVFKHRLNTISVSPSQIWENHPECISNTKQQRELRAEQKRIREQKRKGRERRKRFLSLPKPQANINCYCKELWGKSVFFTTRVLKDRRYADRLFQKRDRLFKRGAILTRDYRRADYVVLRSESEVACAKKENPEKQYISADYLLRLL